MRARVRIWLIVLIGVFVTGCATSGYDAGALQSRLVASGLRPKQATCVVSAMGSQFLAARLDAHSDVTGVELARERALLRVCGVKIAKR